MSEELQNLNEEVSPILAKAFGAPPITHEELIQFVINGLNMDRTLESFSEDVKELIACYALIGIFDGLGDRLIV